MKGLSEAQRGDDELRNVASKAPSDRPTGIATYLTQRREQLVRDIETLSEFDAERRTYRVDALYEIAGKLAVGEVPARKRGRPPKNGGRVDLVNDNVQIERPPARAKTDHLFDLARLMTPDGWRTGVGAQLEEIAEVALRTILKREKIKEQQAVRDEAMRLLRFLNNLEQAGQLAAGELALASGRRF